MGCEFDVMGWDTTTSIFIIYDSKHDRLCQTKRSDQYRERNESNKTLKKNPSSQ